MTDERIEQQIAEYDHILNSTLAALQFVARVTSFSCRENGDGTYRITAEVRLQDDE